MNVYISSDIEGTCGIAHWDETEPGGKNLYESFTKQMSREVAAVSKGALASGAEKVLVKDAHDSARNIVPELLPEGVLLNRGWSGDMYCMMSGIESGKWDAAVCTGYHSAAHDGGNPLSHTMTTTVHEFTINGQRASEFVLSAYTAAYFGVPMCLVSGDADLCAQAKALIPAIATVPVSKGEGNSSTSIHPNLAVNILYDAMCDVLRSGRYKSCIAPLPAHFAVRVTYKNHPDAHKASFYPGAKKENEKTISFDTDDFIEVLRLIRFVM